MNDVTKLHDRREVIRTCLRCGGLLALGGVVSALGLRNLRGNCQRSNPCGGCPLFDGCDLPKAREQKDPKPAIPDHNTNTSNPKSDHA